MEHDYLALLNFVDVGLSIGILAIMLVGFIRGDILSRKSAGELVKLTVADVLDELQDRGIMRKSVE